MSTATLKSQKTPAANTSKAKANANAKAGSPATRDPKSLEGRKFRFTVGSTEEAVELIRKHLGPNARVLSVNQIEGKGIGRFIGAPKLEVIATVPPVEEREAEAGRKKAEAEATRQTKNTRTEGPAPEQNPADNPFRPVGQHLRQTVGEFEADASVQDRIAAKFSESNSRQSTTDRKNFEEKISTENRLSSLLRKARFDESLVTRIECSPKFKQLPSMPLNRALGEVFSILSEDYNSLEQKPLGKRVAFIGTPSVGKTTALCKKIAVDVFQHNLRVKVIKIDADQPNPDDSLRVFCDVTGVQLLRDPVDLSEFEDVDVVYIDTPGASATAVAEWRSLHERLSALECESRILVVNAAYDNEAIRSAYNLGHRNQATHVVFSHIDELSNLTKLWQYLLCGGLPAVFYSHGQDATGDYSEEVLEFMMERTFPHHLVH